jgi:hypothetical protein
MKKQNKSHALMAMAVLVLVVLACSAGDQTEQANKLVSEGNAAVQEGKKFMTEAEELRQKMLHTDVAQLAEARTIAKETIAAYDKAEGKCKEAAKKYEEASKLKIKDKFKEYLALKTKEFNKRAELVEQAKATPQALIDSESRASFVSRANTNNEKVDKLSKEADDIAAEAEKLQKDNPDVLKS